MIFQYGFLKKMLTRKGYEKKSSEQFFHKDNYPEVVISLYGCPFDVLGLMK